MSAFGRTSCSWPEATRFPYPEPDLAVRPILSTSPQQRPMSDSGTARPNLHIWEESDWFIPGPDSFRRYWKCNTIGWGEGEGRGERGEGRGEREGGREGEREREREREGGREREKPSIILMVSTVRLTGNCISWKRTSCRRMPLGKRVHVSLHKVITAPLVKIPSDRQWMSSFPFAVAR